MDRRLPKRVVVDGERSEAAVTSGVPQGSVLGPILFLTFINDMQEHVNSKCRLFADDSIMYREVKSEDDCDSLQKDLNSLHEWETRWGMLFNPSKCHIMHVSRKRKPLLRDYTIKGETLKSVDAATYLGVELTSDLTWNNQVEK